MAVDNKKSKREKELHRAIWAIADELRGAVDGWGILRIMCLEQCFTGIYLKILQPYINAGEIEAGNVDFDYARMKDEEVEEARGRVLYRRKASLFCQASYFAM